MSKRYLHHPETKAPVGFMTREVHPDKPGVYVWPTYVEEASGARFIGKATSRKWALSGVLNGQLPEEGRA